MSKDLLSIEPLAIAMLGRSVVQAGRRRRVTRVIIRARFRVSTKVVRVTDSANQVNLKLPMNYLLWDFFRNPTDFVPG